MRLSNISKNSRNISDEDYSNAMSLANSFFQDDLASVQKNVMSVHMLIFSALKKQREELASIAESFYVGYGGKQQADDMCLLIANTIRKDL